jgi:hypothetical protein
VTARNREETPVRSSTVLLTTTVVSALLYVAGAAVLGTPPDATAPGDDVVAWFAAHGSGVRAYVWCLTLLVPFAGTQIALIRHRLPAPYRDVFLVGGITFLAETAVMGWLWGALSSHAGMLAGSTARALLDVASFWGPVLTGSTTLMLAAVVVAAVREALALPRWVTVLGAVALVEQAIETVTVFGHTGFTAPGGPMNLYLGAVLSLAWFVALGIVLARREPVVTSTVPETAGVR